MSKPHQCDMCGHGVMKWKDRVFGRTDKVQQNQEILCDLSFHHSSVFDFVGLRRRPLRWDHELTSCQNGAQAIFCVNCLAMEIELKNLKREDVEQLLAIQAQVLGDLNFVLHFCGADDYSADYRVEHWWMWRDLGFWYRGVNLRHHTKSYILTLLPKVSARRAWIFAKQVAKAAAFLERIPPIVDRYHAYWKLRHSIFKGALHGTRLFFSSHNRDVAINFLDGQRQDSSLTTVEEALTMHTKSVKDYMWDVALIFEQKGLSLPTEFTKQRLYQELVKEGCL